MKDQFYLNNFLNTHKIRILIIWIWCNMLWYLCHTYNHYKLGIITLQNNWKIIINVNLCPLLLISIHFKVHVLYCHLKIYLLQKVLLFKRYLKNINKINKGINKIIIMDLIQVYLHFHIILHQMNKRNQHNYQITNNKPNK